MLHLTSMSTDTPRKDNLETIREHDHLRFVYISRITFSFSSTFFHLIVFLDVANRSRPYVSLGCVQTYIQGCIWRPRLYTGSPDRKTKQK